MKARFFTGVALTVVGGCLLLGLPAAADEQYMSALVRWNAPTTGSPAVRYLVRIRDLDGTLYETYSVDAVPGERQRFEFNRIQFARRYQAQVSALDTRGRQGPWSNWSAIYDWESSTPQP